MFDKNTILALVIIGIILLMLPMYFKMISPPPENLPANADSLRQRKPEVEKPIARADTLKAPAAVVVDTSRAIARLDSIPVVPDLVTVETPFYALQISNTGRVSGYKLNKYSREADGNVELHVPAEADLKEIGTPDFDFGPGNPRSLSEVRFSAGRTNIVLDSGLDSVRLEGTDPGGRQIILTYVFDAEKYGFELGLTSTGLRVPDVAEFQAKWIGGVPFTESAAVYPDVAPDDRTGHPDHRYAAAYAKVGEELEEIMGSDKPEPFRATGQTHFMAVRSKYFMAALIPLAQPGSGAEMKYYPFERSPQSQHFYDLALHQSWGDGAQGRWRVYWGPIHLKQLKREGVGLEQTMNWGWAIVQPFSKATLWSLTNLRSVIANYGVVIILFSILVKLLLWPLTRKSQISMKKMAALQPQMQAIRELHKNNTQAQHTAVMKMYKDAGVNPASGCIPLLLQMPVLYSLYIVFASTIEFRQAPFMAWISDLSRPDVLFHLPFSIPLYGTGVAILPIIMGISQFFMSKRTVTDPNQKAMLYIMPPMMVFMFNSLPSGLTLYYTMFNFLAIAEQNLIKLPDFTPSAVVVDEPKQKGKSQNSKSRN